MEVGGIRVAVEVGGMRVAVEVGGMRVAVEVGGMRVAVTVLLGGGGTAVVATLVVAVAGAIKPHATRLPESPVASVCSFQPRCAVFLVVAGAGDVAEVIRVLVNDQVRCPNCLFRSAAVNEFAVVTEFRRPIREHVQ